LVIYRAWKKSEVCCLYTLFFQALYITKTNNKTHSSFSLCIWPKQTTKLTLPADSGYNQNKEQNTLLFQTIYITKNKQQNLLFVLVIYRDWKRSVFCCLFWLYPESAGRVSFVVCFGHIQRLKEECVLLFVLVIYRAWKKGELCCLFWLYTESLYIKKTNNKTHSSFRLWI
jgi:hypothetical protein